MEANPSFSRPSGCRGFRFKAEIEADGGEERNFGRRAAKKERRRARSRKRATGEEGSVGRGQPVQEGAAPSDNQGLGGGRRPVSMSPVARRRS